jgi:hypothetical protein
LYPGAEVASSVTAPVPTEWWLRPVSSACLWASTARGVEPVAVRGIGYLLPEGEVLHWRRSREGASDPVPRSTQRARAAAFKARATDRS